MSDVELKLDGLDKLLKALKGASKATLKVGILGDKSNRDGKGKTHPSNAQIGAMHEFGTSSLPIRSFLRVPITFQLNKYLKKAGAFNPETVKLVVSQGTIVPWLKKVGIIAEEIVSDAFNSGGFGNWKPHAPGYTNNSGMVLVDTQQLRNSITSKVEENG